MHGVLYDANLVNLFFDFELVKSKHQHNRDFCIAFGAHLRQIREAKGIGTREFANDADMEYSQLSKIERGVTNPTISTVIALAEALEISHTELFNFRFPRKPR